MNTNVTRGSGEFVVTATGMATEVGHISGMLQAEQAAKTPLTRQLDKLTRQILWIAGIALVVSMVLNLARGDKFTVVFTAAVAFAVGAIPENLPAVVTAILASGTQALARVGAIMKRLQSTETLGSTSAINSDKTGTLTLNQMTAVQMALVGRRYVIEGKGTFADAKFVIATGVSILTLLLTTVFGPLQAFLKTTSLDVRQWLICLAVALSIVVVSEVRKAVARRRPVPSQPITR